MSIDEEIMNEAIMKSFHELISKHGMTEYEAMDIAIKLSLATDINTISGCVQSFYSDGLDVTLI